MKLKVLKYKIIKSTNDVAIKLIKKNLHQPTLIKANKQTRGRGTMGKKWISKNGNLFISIFFEFNPKLLNFKQYAELNAFVLKKILTKYVIKKVKIKWPNDLLIEKKKVCGILQEVLTFNDKFFLIVGIGINTYFAPEIGKTKTSCLKNYSKIKINNNKILIDIKKIYEKIIVDVKHNNFSLIKKKYK